LDSLQIQINKEMKLTSICIGWYICVPIPEPRNWSEVSWTHYSL